MKLQKIKNLIKPLCPSETITVFNREIQAKYLLWILLFLGIFLRVFYLGAVPGGLNQDEAFAGYEAYSLVKYGVDSSGYAFPVYFVSWGSGMNVLNSYLMMPFIAIFGVHAWTVRFPQVLTACVSLYIFYRLFKRFLGEKQALTALAVLAICPWHIMMSRWGLESNLAPGFLLFGLYAFVLGVEKPKFYIVSAVCYGLSLYCYATIWPVVPLLLILQALYLVWVKKFKISIEMVIAVVVLAFLAMPLLFFLLINNGYMDEIKLGFFSIPKLIYMRDSEISFSNISMNFKNLWNILWTQNDSLIWNCTEKFGLYYKGGFVVAIAGFIYSGYRTIKSIIKRKFDLHALLMINFLVALALGCLVYVNVNRINCIHISIVAFIAVALFRFFDVICKKTAAGKYAVAAVVLAGYLGVFSFANYYFEEYAKIIEPVFQKGLDEALEYANEIAQENDTIYVSPIYSYSKVLLLDEFPVKEYIDTVQFSNYPSAYLTASSFGKYVFDFDTLYGEGVYVVDKDYGQSLIEYGFDVKVFDTVAVAKYNYN